MHTHNHTYTQNTPSFPAEKDICYKIKSTPPHSFLILKIKYIP